MKKYFSNPRRSIAALVAGLMFLIINAHATVFVSNLAEGLQNGVALGSDRWLAQSFQTGANADGYSLNSISVHLGVVSSPSDNVTVALYSDNGGVPGNKLGNLDGPANPANGDYTYTASGINLSPSANYWVVISSTAAIGDSFHYWGFAASANYTATDGWNIGLNNFKSENSGNSWSQLAHNPYLMAVDATAVQFEIRSGVKSNDGFALTFFGVTNQSYAVEANTNLATSNWLTMTNLIGGGSNQTVTVSATNPATFFRLRSP